MTPALFLQFLPYLIQGAQEVPKLIEYIAQMRANFKQVGQWTNDEDAKFNQSLIDMGKDPAWIPDDIGGTPVPPAPGTK